MKLSNPFRRKPKQEVKHYANTDQGWMDTSWDAGWWQQDLTPKDMGKNETVEACVSTLSQTVSMCPAEHLSLQDDNEAKRNTGSYVERVLLNPNQYTTRSLFFNELIRSVYFYGNGYAVATRDGNRAINSLHNVDARSVTGVIDPDSGDVYYWVSPNRGTTYNPDTDVIYPARDVLNVRINPKRNEPLKGESPIIAAARSISAGSAITGHQSKFFNSMARPSGIFSTDAALTKEQMLQLREAIAQQTQGANSGKIPVLGNGMKFESMSLTSQDAQLIEAYDMTVQSICRVFRVPIPLISSMQGATYNNAETMMNWFLSSGLGFLLEHIELELTRLFGLPFSDRINFNTKALLRSDWKTQIEALGEGVLKGIYSPNEARAMLGLGEVEAGEEPRVQQQVVPLSAWDQSLNQPAPEPEPAVDVMASFNKGYASAR
jgi:HK97 family phage portal protein